MLAFNSSPDEIGCESDAFRAVRDDLPYLDHGLFKRVYCDEAQATVYKVVRPGNGGEAAIGNGRRLNLLAEAAWSAYGIARGVPGIPPVTLYIVEGVTVLAMPFYPQGARWGYAQDEIDAWHDMGLEDLHDGNWRCDANGNPFVIDLGGWANGFPHDVIPTDVYTAVTETTAPDVEDVHDDYCDCDECCGDRCGCGDGCTAGDCAACDDEDAACGIGHKVPATNYENGIWLYCERDDQHAGPHTAWDWVHLAQIEWDSTPIPAMCNAVSPDQWVCSLDEGHVGDHEGWGARVPNVHDEPFDVWPNANPVMPGDPAMGDGCQETNDYGLICCLDLWHKGRHEAWGIEHLLDTWERDVEREHEELEKIGVYEPNVLMRCNAFKGGFQCTVMAGHPGAHIAHAMWGEHQELERWLVA